MVYNIEIKQRAVLMVNDAFEWYEEQKTSLGESFLSCLDIAFDKIKLHPEYYSICHDSYRQINVPKFPFVIVFEIFETTVIVFAVFHTSRNENFKIKDY